jgi:hypothetical protein
MKHSAGMGNIDFNQPQLLSSKIDDYQDACTALESQSACVNATNILKLVYADLDFMLTLELERGNKQICAMIVPIITM